LSKSIEGGRTAAARTIAHRAAAMDPVPRRQLPLFRHGGGYHRAHRCGRVHAEYDRGPRPRIGRFRTTLEHDPEKWKPVFPRDKREAFARRSCSIKEGDHDAILIAS